MKTLTFTSVLAFSLGCAGSVCDVCPPPAYAVAEVRGVVYRADGEPAAARQIYVGGCSGTTGHFDAATRANGAFTLRLVQDSSLNTSIASFPPDTNGYFTLAGCRASTLLNGSLVARWESLSVRFGRVTVETPVTWLELREQ
jgi:hypothetical protein